jgi:EipB-like
MRVPSGRAFALALWLAPALGGVAHAVDIAPHRALYSLELGAAKQGSGVVSASGSMAFEWGEACDGWTVEQRYRLAIRHEDGPNSDVVSNFVTWEAKDGLRYRFNLRKLKNGEIDEEVRGEATLEGPGKGGKVAFVKPEPASLDLAPGVIFPTAHTELLIERAAAGDQFVARHVFDGASKENAAEVTAVIGATQAKGAAEPLGGALLQRPSWRMRLAFFPPNAAADKPDYELGMRLFDNGVSRDMVLDYGDFAVKAKLEKLEPLGKPSC